MGFNRCCLCLSLHQATLIISTASAVVYGAVFIWLLVRHEIILGFFQQESQAIQPILWLLVALSGIICLCMLFGAFASLRQNQTMMRLFKAMYWAVAAVVLVMTLAAWAVLLAKRDSAVSSCNEYLSQVRGSRDLPGSGVFGVYDGDCDASVRNLIIVGALIVFIGNALQIYWACIVSASVSRMKDSVGHQQLRDLEDHYYNSSGYPPPPHHYQQQQQQYYYAAQPSQQPQPAIPLQRSSSTQKPPMTY
ncbi:hypothetical protein BDB00DRAFT_820884 [Zychaea mexicana]|uniref:uncharacterized protein n=1 Tax=Zychaea mexicana TaxID=64656 RepID=UPI0022FE5CB7|nr:uncharacterized protein BDB00DRAFT_820884 [Zychaea mexicana]KAI9494103.1 hypothetical protein BDB00DRAFT_820884 [Zychaea mexicana]